MMTNTHRLEVRRQVLLEPLGDPVVLPQEDDVQRGEERLLV